MNWSMGTLVAGLTVFLPATAFGHGGGLDAYGCHNNRKLGGYHCHRGSFAGQQFLSKDDMLSRTQPKETSEKPQPATTKKQSKKPAWPTKVEYEVEVVNRDDVSGSIKKLRHTILIKPMPTSDEDIKRVLMQYVEKLRAGGKANISVSAVRSRKDDETKWYGRALWIHSQPEPQIMIHLEPWPED